LFAGCALFFLACLRSFFDPEFCDHFLRFSAWHLRVKEGTRIGVVSVVTAALLSGSFRTLIGFSVFHFSGKSRIASRTLCRYYDFCTSDIALY
jgi:hypothetical protein